MEDTSKYLIHARITADGVVERSDVVGAVFGQTEGLLGDELDLRDLQQSSKIGRIDVEIDSEHGQSFGELTITSSLDKVETAILAASLESITRVGPCEARVEVAEIEDMRAAKRREVVERAKELLAESFDDGVMDSTEILAEVRDAQRVERIDDYAGYPAGPRVADSDAVIVVEGRADVTTLLDYGIKNAVAVEGTNVPGEVADLTQERTVTAFLDGDRGGDLILRELAQVGDVDYVAYAPEGTSVEDLSREAVMNALRDKVPFETLPAADQEQEETASSSRASTNGAGGESESSVTAGDGENDRTTGSVRTSGTDGREAVGGVGATSESSVTVDPEAVADEIAGDEAATDDGVGEATSETVDGDDTTDGADETVDGAASETADGDGTDETVDGEEPDATVDGDETDATIDAAEEESETVDGDDEEGVETVDADDEEGIETDETVDTADGEEESETADGDDDEEGVETDETVDGDDDEEGTETDETVDGDEESVDTPATLRGHVEAVIDAGTNTARLLDREMGVVADVPVGAAFDTLADEETTGFALVVDGQVDQRLLDVAAQRGIGQIVAQSSGEFVKRPASVRVVTADRIASA